MYAKGKYDLMRGELKKANWEAVLQEREADVNKQWNYIKERILEASNKYIPKRRIVVMRKEREVYSVSCIGVLPFIEGSLGDCTKWSGSC